MNQFKKSENKVFCVISHTHWDREWYSPLEHFRLRLIDLFDRLLVILDEHPHYVFHMDAQTIVLEDYLAVRPEKHTLLKQYISQRRIIIGPWYLQNDFYLTSGESTVRNLIIGDKQCREFGGKGDVGYAPDQFGNISQLPQILKNFGLNSFVFGRGFSRYEKNAEGQIHRHPSPTEFIWQGADGTQVMAIHMRHWYNNAQRFSADVDKALRHLKTIEQCYDNEFTLTPYLLLMNGVDHLEAQPDLLEILDQMQPRLSQGQYILQYNMDDYVQDVARYIEDNDLSVMVHKGELRSGHDWEILKGTLSSRHYLKVMNVHAQVLLENQLEPLYSMLELNGLCGVYSSDHMEYLWKNLIRNHAHDSICGCSRDEVHRHMENRYEELFEFGTRLLERGMQEAANHTAALRNGQPENYLITVANTLSFPMEGAVSVTLDILKSENFEGLDIVDAAGNPVECEIVSVQPHIVDVQSPFNLPGSLEADRYTLYLDAGRVEPWSFKTFTVRRGDARPCITVKQDNEAVLDNGHLRVQVASDGRVTMTELATGRVFENCVKIEDLADQGDSYVYIRATDEPIYSTAFTPAVEVLCKNRFEQTCRITIPMQLPADFDFETKKRTAETVETVVTLDITLKKDGPLAEVAYRVDNRSKNHRMRLVVTADVVSDVSTADIPFDVVTHGEEAHYVDTYSKVLPNTSFASLSDGANGLVVLTGGAHEYEHMNGNQLAFTIVRATGRINVGDASDGWAAPGNQCLRVLSGRLALRPFEGDVVRAGAVNWSLAFRAPLLVNASSCDPHKFTGGRPAVQDTTIQEFFYLPDAYPEAIIPDNTSAITVEGENIAVTAFKKAENQRGMVVRLCNYANTDSQAVLKARGKIYFSSMNEIRRDFVALDEVCVTLSAKEIKTLIIV